MQLSDYSMMTHTKNLCRLLHPVKVQSVTIHAKVVLLRVGITGVKKQSMSVALFTIFPPCCNFASYPFIGIIENFSLYLQPIRLVLLTLSATAFYSTPTHCLMLHMAFFKAIYDLGP